MYLAIGKRPDIVHAVSALSQFNARPNKAPSIAAKRILRYLKGTINLKLVDKRDEEHLNGYVYADWANCIIDKRSYTGLVFILSGAAISWESQKQQTVALSSTEAE
ncbi:secreted RxLR effector protein 161-like [Belonocnema kinseyi]|uniref:secreted RxLR effector protein 161-like n=1 Tax=Belonocnema kinseyi TaxID=2817044 RepID=UPI00143D04BA|nr:secreted RxLR effector protein 161-like [Belonocnema kinseyi]